MLTDLNGDGYPDQCTCVRVDRVKPATLILWPEFDNRPGQITLLTISNTNRNYINGFVRVEFRYIDADTCLETNRSHNMTPNDTLTVVTRTHQGGQNRGYAYAYACDPQGTPISYNFLIGSEIVLDGLEALDYGMNAFAWRAIPPVRQPTDLDNDGIRDLNGIEYEPAPDVILIPRFLGQGPTTHGSLLFVALTGGVQFTTHGRPADLQRQRGSVLGAVHVPLLGQGAVDVDQQHVLELAAARVGGRSERGGRGSEHGSGVDAVGWERRDVERDVDSRPGIPGGPGREPRGVLGVRAAVGDVHADQWGLVAVGVAG